MTRDPTPLKARTVAAVSALLGGLGWLLLIPGAELHSREVLSYDSYNRVIVLPLLALFVALYAASRTFRPLGRLLKGGFVVAVVAAGLLVLGNVIEFYGVLLQSKPNAYDAYQSGQTSHYIGSDIGWIIFAIGMLLCLVAGVPLAAGLAPSRRAPRWLVLFFASLGVGPLAANVSLGSVIVSAPILFLYAAGWVAFGVWQLNWHSRGRRHLL